jgi:cellulose synthase/poly-beta-1,6-N-acetylglucosamine synthase-like glycosyltransferase
LNYPKDSIEVLVIDGLSKDATVQKAQKYNVKVVSAPLSAPAAYNYAMKIVKYPVLGFIDADAKVEKEWLNKLVPYLNDPQVAGVSGEIETWNFENPWARTIGYDIKYRYQRIKTFVNRIATMNLLLKKKVIEEVGGFDEHLPSQYDTDLGVRITSKGYKIAFNPDAYCYHFNRPTIRTYFKQQLQYGKNTVKLYFKHAKLIRGDKITGFGMNIQPVLLLSIILLFLLGIAPMLRPLWYVSAALLLAIFFYYLYLAIALSVKFKDRAAMLMIILAFVRSIAWLTGATISTIKYISKSTR